MVIGSGAGGAAAAFVLARAGWQVTVLEKGRNYFRGLDDPSGLSLPLFGGDEIRRARGFPGIDTAAFCAVVREAGDPRRPAGYVPLDAFWRKRGYAPVPGLIGRISWRDLDEAEESLKPMQFWIKELT